mgnify:CR=1 FL=1
MRIKHEYTNTRLKRKDILHPELSCKIIGAAFEVYNQLGWGHNEKVYQRAFASSLEKLGLNFEKEKMADVKFNGQKIAKKFLDFFIDDKVIVELKIAPKFGYVHINQVSSYLKTIGAKLAIIIYFLQDGVRYRRVVNYLS